MIEVSEDNAVDYLHAKGRISRDALARASALGGGVSNVVLRVEIEGQAPIVIKQARERLRTAKEWRCKLDRIWTEVAALERLGEIGSSDSVPKILFQERDDYLFAMSHAPNGSVVWKELLLAGDAEPKLARLAGETLGLWHARTFAKKIDALLDLEIFDQLRVDPYYRAIALVHETAAKPIGELIDLMNTTTDRTLVHADFSPKNILIHENGLTVVDFETAHVGDPAFDLGFFASHLLLKSIHMGKNHETYHFLLREFFDSYRGQVEGLPGRHALGEREARAIRHASACCLARVDGKSPVEYLDEAGRAIARAFALEALREPPKVWEDLTSLLKRRLV